MFKRKKEAIKMMNVMTESEAYKMYLETKQLKQNEINNICEDITASITKQSKNKKYYLKTHFNYWNVRDSTFYGLLEYSKGIKIYFKEKGYNVRTFIFVTGNFDLTLFVHINWRFK